jgi:hypothetical protein
VIIPSYGRACGGKLPAGGEAVEHRLNSTLPVGRSRLGRHEDFPQKILRLAQPTSDPCPSAFRATWYWRPLRGELAGDP